MRTRNTNSRTIVPRQNKASAKKAKKKKTVAKAKRIKMAKAANVDTPNNNGGEEEIVAAVINVRNNDGDEEEVVAVVDPSGEGDEEKVESGEKTIPGVAGNLVFNINNMKTIWENNRRHWIENQVANKHQTHSSFQMKYYDDKGNYKTGISKCLQKSFMCVVDILF